MRTEECIILLLLFHGEGKIIKKPYLSDEGTGSLVVKGVRKKSKQWKKLRSKIKT